MAVGYRSSSMKIRFHHVHIVRTVRQVENAYEFSADVMNCLQRQGTSFRRGWGDKCPGDFICLEIWLWAKNGSSIIPAYNSAVRAIKRICARHLISFWRSHRQIV